MHNMNLIIGNIGHTEMEEVCTQLANWTVKKRGDDEIKRTEERFHSKEV